MFIPAGIQQFSTKEQAEQQKATMCGYNSIEVKKVEPLPFLPVSEENKEHYIIICDGNKHLYDDGMVKF